MYPEDDAPESDPVDTAPDEPPTPTRESDSDVPAVDELEERLRGIENAMASAQSGELDVAEETVAALEDRIGLPSD
ncbi:MAG: hypothetical protein ACR2P0_01770 [Acidimicrobiales bacterium]